MDWQNTTMNPKLADELNQLNLKVITTHRLFYVNTNVTANTGTTQSIGKTYLRPQDPAVIVGDALIGSDGYIGTVTAVGQSNITYRPTGECVIGGSNKLCYSPRNINIRTGGSGRGTVAVSDVYPTPVSDDFILGANGYIARVMTVNAGTCEYQGTGMNLSGYTDITDAADEAVQLGEAVDVRSFMGSLTTEGRFLYSSNTSRFYCVVDSIGGNWVIMDHYENTGFYEHCVWRNGATTSVWESYQGSSAIRGLGDPTSDTDAVNRRWVLNNAVTSQQPTLYNPTVAGQLTIDENPGTQVALTVTASQGVDILQISGDNTAQVIRGLSDPIDNSDAVNKGYVASLFPFIFNLAFDGTDYTTDVTSAAIAAAVAAKRRIIGVFDGDASMQEYNDGYVEFTYIAGDSQNGSLIYGFVVSDQSGLEWVTLDYSGTNPTWSFGRNNTVPTFYGTTAGGDARCDLSLSYIVSSYQVGRSVSPIYKANGETYCLTVVQYEIASNQQKFVCQCAIHNKTTGAVDKLITCTLDSNGTDIVVYDANV